MGDGYRPVHRGRSPGSGNRRAGPAGVADFAALLGGAINELEKRTGFVVTERHTAIPEGMSFRAWCEMLGRDGMKVDGKPFRLDDRPAMAWIYDQIPTTQDEAYMLTLVLMKCAQVGFTVMEMLATIYIGLKFGPCTVGMFLPDQNLAQGKSTERFMPVVRSVPAVHKLMTQDDPDGGGRKAGEGNVMRRRIDQALFLFAWTSGRSTTESFPMDMLSFDEVQEMAIEAMEKAGERLSASAVRFTLMGSTANWPESDIHHWYLKGTRYRFHTKCPTCGKAEPLDEYFPACIGYDKVADIHHYLCRDGHRIDDPQSGEWIAENPDADKGPQPGVPLIQRRRRIRSIHFPQFLSPTIGPGQILDAFHTAEDMKNFYNRKLGKPYTDPSLVPVNLAHLKACEAAGIAAGLRWKERARHTFMGIDQMGRFNVHVIKERLEDGRQAIVHVEETYHEDPFARSSELMDLYGVRVCVVEINPNYNDAKRFANRHPGRVFICDSFGSIIEGMVQWGDAPKLDVSERRTTEEGRDRYTLKMDQYKCMQVSMMRFVNGLCLSPDSKDLVQEVYDKGVKSKSPVPILPRMWHHLTKTALVAEKDEETNKFKRSVKKIGIDPHFSYANMLCDVAWSRAHGTSTFLMPDTSKDEAMAVADDLKALGVPQHVAEQVVQPPKEETCGNCEAFDPETRMCKERWFKTKPESPGCEMFIWIGS